MIPIIFSAVFLTGATGWAGDECPNLDGTFACRSNKGARQIQLQTFNYSNSDVIYVIDDGNTKTRYLTDGQTYDVTEAKDVGRIKYFRTAYCQKGALQYSEYSEFYEKDYKDKYAENRQEMSIAADGKDRISYIGTIENNINGTTYKSHYSENCMKVYPKNIP